MRVAILFSMLITLGANFALAGPQLSLPEDIVDPDSLSVRIQMLGAGPQVSAGCCKTCRKGQACGNACISRSKACHVGQGCACNG